MAWAWDDRWLWLGLGLWLRYSQGITCALQDTVQLSEIKDPNITKANVESDAEEAIGLDALHTLSRSSNPDIANAALSLLISRFALSDAGCDSLTLELFSPSAQTRRRAKQVLELIDSQPLAADVHKPDVLRVERVQELRNATKSDDVRTQSMCMAFFRSFGPLSQGIGSLAGVADAVEAAMGLPLPLPAGSAFQSYAFSNNGMRALALDHDGAAGDPLGRRYPRTTLGALEPLAELLERTDGIIQSLGRNVDGSRRARFHEESPEETEVRRRRREAMVFHEGSGALGREDIIHPRTRMP
ncbi:hypothetical protein MBLNU459_g4628t2 [Dothideomycetes sp. NU459]